MMISFDGALLAVFASWRGDFVDPLFLALTWLGSLWVLLPLALICAALRWPARAAWPALPLGLLLSTASSQLLKLLVQRPRPALHEALTALPADASFPSSHAAQIAAFASAVVLLAPADRRVTAVLSGVVAALAVGVSRLHLQVHWPSDVLAGWMLGLLAAWAAVSLTRRGTAA